MPPPTDPELAAILLAGGRGSRMGGVEKALLRRDGQTQIRRWLQELHARDLRTVVVGPASLRPEVPTSVPLVQETPAFAGPAAGVLSGAAELDRHLQELEDSQDLQGIQGRRDLQGDPDGGSIAAPSRWTLLLAVDLARPAALLDWLLEQLLEVEELEQPDAVIPRDESGRHQYLSAAVPTDWLRRRVPELRAEQAEDRPLRWLLQGLDESTTPRHPVLPRGLSDDVDTLQDAHRLGISLP